MSRHYRPHLKDDRPGFMARGWQLAIQQGLKAIAALRDQAKAGLERCLRMVVRPDDAAGWSRTGVRPVIPTLEELEREFRPAHGKTRAGEPFPGPLDRYRAHLEEQLAKIAHRPLN